MNTPTVVASFSFGLGALLAASYGIGNAVGPIGNPSAAHSGSHQEPNASGPDAHAAHGDAQPATSRTDFPGGLMVSQDGYALDLHRDIAQPGRGQLVEFSVTGPNGEPVTTYEVEHEKQLHLIAVRRDFAGFQHVHPDLDAEGTWSVPLNLQAGQWRIFADFTPARGHALTLGADLLVSGHAAATQKEQETRTAQVDGYTVTLAGILDPGADAELTLSVSRDGKPVTDLQPYLGAYGHVVALREGDLAYLHVHPDGTPGDGHTEAGPDVRFYAAVPSAGNYHLYLDFKHDGVVRTAHFILGTDQDTSSDPKHAGVNGDQEHDESNHGH